ncbi:MAG: WYL domain-containing protein, partial [Jiangellaceae bacterium]
AWDVDRDHWRTFRIDRISPHAPTGPRFAPRDLTEDEVAARVSRGAWAVSWTYRARVRVHVSADALAGRIPAAVGTVEAVDADSCLLDTGADTLETLAVHLGMLGADFEVSEPAEVVDHLRLLADRYARATPPRSAARNPAAGG